MLCKCITGKENIDIENYLAYGESTSRGHSKKLYKRRGDKDVRKFSFPNRAIDQWNALPNEIVCVNTIHKFKDMYDKYVKKYGTIRA